LFVCLFVCVCVCVWERVSTGRVCNCSRLIQVVHILSFYQWVFEEQETTLFSIVQRNSYSMHCRFARCHCNCEVVRKSTTNSDTHTHIKKLVLCDNNKKTLKEGNNNKW
jgi:hypothetical protein